MIYKNLHLQQFAVQQIYPFGRWNLPQVKNHWSRTWTAPSKFGQVEKHCVEHVLKDFMLSESH